MAQQTDENQAMQTSKQNLTESTSGFSTKAEFAVGVLVNKTRFPQGWTALPIAELKPVAKDWQYHLERHGVPAQYYQEILDRAVDRRIMHLAKSEHVPMLSVELLLAMFRELKTDLHEECHKLDREFKEYRGLLLNIGDGELPEAVQIQIVRKSNALLKTDVDTIDQAKSNLEYMVGRRDAEIQSFWTERHLPGEAKEWM